MEESSTGGKTGRGAVLGVEQYCRLLVLIVGILFIPSCCYGSGEDSVEEARVLGLLAFCLSFGEL